MWTVDESATGIDAFDEIRRYQRNKEVESEEGRVGEWLGVGNIIIIAESLFKYTPIPNIIQLNPVFHIVLCDFVWHGCVFVFLTISTFS